MNPEKAVESKTINIINLYIFADSILQHICDEWLLSIVSNSLYT
jgi:hypothetical protein